MVKGSVTGAAIEAEAIGIQLAQQLRDQGASDILAEIFEQIQRS
jgi:hydroxymethylbilane synthase